MIVSNERSHAGEQRTASGVTGVIAAALFAGYLVLSILVGLRLLVAFDIAATGAVQSIATPTLDWIGQRMSYLAAAEACAIWSVALSAWLWARGLGWRAGAPLLLFLSVPIEFAGKILVLQPDVIDEMMRVDMKYYLLTLQTGNTFPSGNATRTTIVYGLMGWLLARRLSTPLGKSISLLTAALVILFVGLSRAYIGYHWFTDVIGGYFLGGSVLALMIGVLRGELRPWELLGRWGIGRKTAPATVRR